MSNRFLDTNILVYACDMDEPAKQKTARKLLRQVAGELSPCISTQVHQEFYVTATRKLKITPLKAKDIIHSFRHMRTVTIDLTDINKAIEGNILWQVSFWDALIIVAAQKARCEILYTEDFNDGQRFDGLQVCNPFK